MPRNISTEILEAVCNIALGLHSHSLIDQNSKENIQQAFSSPPYISAQIFIKSLMLITIPFLLLSYNRTNAKPLDDDAKKHLAQEKVWEAMLRLAKILSEFANDTNKRNDLKALEEEHAKLRESLLSNVPTSSERLLDETLQLLRLSAQIFRRFQQRSVALIRLLDLLDRKSLTQNAPVGRDEVRKAFQKTFELLKATEEKFRGRSLRASLTDREYDERATAFEQVFSDLRQCSKLVDPSTSWISKEVNFLAAVELDETHMKERECFQPG